MTYNKEKLRELKEELLSWHRKIIRKNASENEIIVEERKKKHY